MKKARVAVRPEDVARLHALFDELNRDCFGGALLPLPLAFSARLRNTGGAYRRIHPALSDFITYDMERKVMRIDINARYLALEDGWAEIRDTLGHEMIHYWLHSQGLPSGHTPAFWRKLKEHGWSRYSRLPPVGALLVYKCPNCERKYHALRPHRVRRSCGPCSGRFFDVRFALEFVERIDGRQP